MEKRQPLEEKRKGSSVARGLSEDLSGAVDEGEVFSCRKGGEKRMGSGLGAGGSPTANRPPTDSPDDVGRLHRSEKSQW